MDDPADAADHEGSSKKPYSRFLRARRPGTPSSTSPALAASASLESLDMRAPKQPEAPLLRRNKSFVSEGGRSSPSVLGTVHNSSSTRRVTRPRDDKSKTSAAGGLENMQPLALLPGPLSDQLETVQPLSRPTSRRARVLGLRSSSRRRSNSGSQSGYLESLEAQVAALQTQLQSSSSPSLQRSNSSRLRALNTETKLLRQEISEWEKTFNDRVREQIEQYELVAGSLRARIRFLEKERDNKDQRIEELESQFEGRGEALDAAERANQVLEARLDSMSNLVSAPAPKLQLNTDLPPPTRHRHTRSRTGIPVTPISNRAAVPREPLVSSPLRSPHSRRQSEMSISFDHSFHSGNDSAADSGYMTELASETSDGNFLEAGTPSAGRPNSWAPSTSADAMPRSRPSQRRMRRFYAGNTAQSLILPAARSAGDTPLSAPVSMLQSSHVPVLTSPTRERYPVHSPTSSRGSISFDFRQRSATIHESSQLDLSSPGKDGETPRTVNASHSRHATESQIVTPDRGYARSYRDPRREDLMLRHTDTLNSDLSTVTGPSLTPNSPLRMAFGPELNIDEVLATPLKTIRTPTRPKTSPGPHTKWGRLVGYVHQSFEAHMVAARCMFASTWQDMAVARPVLEFRCWLVRVLLGRLRDQGTLFIVRKSAGRASSANPAGIGLRMGIGSPVALGTPRDLRDDSHVEEDIILEAIDESGIILPPVAPPLHWLRFSMTMLCAVGVALKDGPATLFPRAARSVPRSSISHTRKRSLYELFMPGNPIRL